MVFRSEKGLGLTKIERFERLCSIYEHRGMMDTPIFVSVK